MLTLTISNPAYPPGKVFSINGLGAFENGVPTEITIEQEETFFTTTGKRVQEIPGVTGIAQMLDVAPQLTPEVEFELAHPVVPLENQGGAAPVVTTDLDSSTPTNEGGEAA